MLWDVQERKTKFNSIYFVYFENYAYWILNCISNIGNKKKLVYECTRENTPNKAESITIGLILVWLNNKLMSLHIILVNKILVYTCMNKIKKKVKRFFILITYTIVVYSFHLYPKQTKSTQLSNGDLGNSGSWNSCSEVKVMTLELFPRVNSSTATIQNVSLIWRALSTQIHTS